MLTAKMPKPLTGVLDYQCLHITHIIRSPKAVVFFLSRIEITHNVLLNRGELGHKITFFRQIFIFFFILTCPEHSIS